MLKLFRIKTFAQKIGQTEDSRGFYTAYVAAAAIGEAAERGFSMFRESGVIIDRSIEIETVEEPFDIVNAGRT